jgi:hypothetical protein
MLILDATTKTIVVAMSGAATTTNPSFVSAYSDDTGSAFTEGSNDGALNGTTSVTLVAAPAASTRRLVKTIYVANIDTAAVTLTISYNNNATLRTIAKVTLQVGDTWSTDGTTDTSGNLKTTVGSVNVSNVTGILPATNGGTGIANNVASTIAISGNFGTTITVTGTTAVTLPTTGTLVNTAVTTLSSLASIGTIGSGTWNGSLIGATYGGTGVNNGSNTITLGGSLTTTGAFASTFAVSGAYTYTLPAATDTLVNLGSTQTLTSKTLTNPTVTNYVETLYAPAAGSAFSISLANGTVQQFSLNANGTLTLPSSVAGKSFTIIVTYSGSYSLTWAGGGTLKWAGGTTPTATSTSGKYDIFNFYCDGTNTYGSVYGLNY